MFLPSAVICESQNKAAFSERRPVLAGGYSQPFFESSAEYALGGKTSAEADILYRQPSIFQKVFCGGNPGIDEIFMGSEPCFLFKNAYKVELAESCVACQLF